jgi:PAS domain S-box-containing protein
VLFYFYNMKSEQKDYSETALEKSYRTLFQSLRDGFLLGEIVYNKKKQIDNIRIMDSNSTLCDIIGKGFDEIVGSYIYPDFTFLLEWGNSWKDTVLQIISGEIIRSQFKKHGKSVIVSITGFSSKDESIFLVVKDISSEIQLEKHAAETQMFVRNLIDVIPSPVFFKDENGKYRECNNAFADMILGLPKERILGRGFEDLTERIPPEKARVYQAHDDALFKSGTSETYSSEVLCADNVVRYFLFHKAVIQNSEGESIGIVGIMTDMSDENRLKTELEKNEEKYRLLTDNTLDCIFTLNLKMEVMYVNPAIATVLGYQPEEWKNRSFSSFLSVDEFTNFKKIINNELKLNEKSTGRVFIARLTHKAGNIVPVEISLKLLFDSKGNANGIQANARDVTKLVQIQKKLKHTTRYVESIISSIDSLLIGVDTKDRIRLWNRHCETLFNIQAVDAIGKKVTELKLKWDWATVLEAVAMCMSSLDSYHAGDLIYKQGEITYTLSISVHPVFIGGKIQGFLIYARDVSSERVMEQELNQSSRLQSIGQLAAGISHEINTPAQYVGDNIRFFKDIFSEIEPLFEFLTTSLPEMKNDKLAMNELDLILQSCDVKFMKDEIPRAIVQSLEGMERISKIVKSMKSFAHPGSEKKQKHDIHKAIIDTVNITRNEWKYDSEIEMQLTAEQFCIYCFPGELNQTMLNILVNAAHAVHEAVEQNLIERGKITISTKRTEYEFHITFSDNGTGMDKAVLDRIFDPFFTTKVVGKGTGQGLSLAYNTIVKKHKGRIDVSSEKGKGSVFNLILPVKGSDDEKNYIC